jgi:prephenate dehydrogenase
VLDAVAASGVADSVSTDAAAAVDGADLVVLATPVGVMGEVVTAAAGSLAAGALVTDVGSVKAPVVAAVAPQVAARGATFLGSHPMAGSEHAGFENARPDLFEGAACILTPQGGEPARAVEALQAFWEALGCRVWMMPPAAHDRVAARVSHVPHAVAAALVEAALNGDGDATRFIGQGFRDTTRVAAGDPALWTGILTENRTAVVDGLREVGRTIDELASALERGDEPAVRRFLDRSSKLRQGCPPRH